MTEPVPPRPAADASGPNDAPEVRNHIGRSVSALLRGAQRALSPWLQRLVQIEPRSAARPRAQRQPYIQPPPSGGRPAAPFGFAGRPVGLAGAGLQRLGARIQRRSDRTTAWQGSVAIAGPAQVDRFVTSVARRFPPVAAKYEPRPMQSPGAVQRSPMPFVQAPSETGLEADSFDVGQPAAWGWPPGTGQPSQEPAPSALAPGESLTARLRSITHGSPAIQRSPAAVQPSYETPAPPLYTPDESLTALLRNITHGPAGAQRSTQAEPPQPSPREVSRRAMGAARAARREPGSSAPRAEGGQGPRVRRAVIEEITPAQEPPVQRQPELAPAPPAPSTPEPEAGAGAPLGPGLMVGRPEAASEALPLTPRPGIQRKETATPEVEPPPSASTSPAVQPEPAQASPQPPAIQRQVDQPGLPDRPAAPPRVPPGERPAARTEVEPAKSPPSPPEAGSTPLSPAPPVVQGRGDTTVGGSPAEALQPEPVQPAGPPDSAAPLERGSGDMPVRVLQRKGAEPPHSGPPAPQPLPPVEVPPDIQRAVEPPEPLLPAQATSRESGRAPRQAGTRGAPLEEPGLPPGGEVLPETPRAEAPTVRRKIDQALPVRAPRPQPDAPAAAVKAESEMLGGEARPKQEPVGPSAPGPTAIEPGLPETVRRQAVAALPRAVTVEDRMKGEVAPSILRRPPPPPGVAARPLPMVNRKLLQSPPPAVPEEGGRPTGGFGTAEAPASLSAPSLDLPLQLWRAPYKASESRVPTPPAAQAARPAEDSGAFGGMALTPSPAPSVQRKPEKPAPVRRTAEPKVQRADAKEAPKLAAKAEDVKEKSVDLADLARKIYPLIKRMLAVERERH